ncbi:MAG: hypothetical protein AAFZ80_00845 [Cyanobacteria bacterium P01_A01_bin.105]
MTREPPDGRRFELADAIAREGASFLKGDDAIPRPLRAMAQVNEFIAGHLHDPGGALKVALQNWVRHDLRISQHLDQPLDAMRLILTDLTTRPQTFYEFARQVNMTWGQLTGEVPHFQKPGQPPHPEAEYPHDRIQSVLVHLQACVVAATT